MSVNAKSAYLTRKGEPFDTNVLFVYVLLALITHSCKPAELLMIKAFTAMSRNNRE